ncbi:hypothetical protein FRC11_000985, partial [Ceratobasidium sp. 423]
MTLPDAVQTRISALETRLSKCKRKLNRLRKTERFEEHDKVRDEEFIGVFKDTCALVREAELADAPYLGELAKAADKILDDGVGYSYGRDSNSAEFEEGVYDFMPSWAHDDDGGRPLIKDENGGKFPLPHAALESFIRIFQPRLGGGAADLASFKTEPWNASSKRHPKSTNLSRFRSNLPTLTSTIDKPLAASVLDARCEISSSRCVTPIRFHTNLGNTCLALTGMGGWKNRSSAMDYLIINEPLPPSATFPTLHWFEPKVSGIAYHAAVDDARRLIFVGGDRRIKSFEWGSPSEVHKDPSLVHILDTQRSEGPMTVLPNGSIVRAGRGGASVWDTQALDNNENDESIEEPDGSDDDGDWEDEDSEEANRTAGSPPSSQIKFLDQPNLKPSLWQPLLTAPSTVICVEYARQAGNYSCIGIDLETGKSTSYYLGHGADVSSFSVSAADPQLFLTACNDGFA